MSDRPMRDGWVAVDERLPEDGVEVLAWDSDCYWLAMRHSENWQDSADWDWELLLTHWMPLPEPPKEASVARLPSDEVGVDDEAVST